jgi:hypothetical protein
MMTLALVAMPAGDVISERQHNRDNPGAEMARAR